MTELEELNQKLNDYLLEIETRYKEISDFTERVGQVMIRIDKLENEG